MASECYTKGFYLSLLLITEEMQGDTHKNSKWRVKYL